MCVFRLYLVRQPSPRTDYCMPLHAWFRSPRHTRLAPARSRARIHASQQSSLILLPHTDFRSPPSPVYSPSPDPSRAPRPIQALQIVGSNACGYKIPPLSTTLELSQTSSHTCRRHPDRRSRPFHIVEATSTLLCRSPPASTRAVSGIGF